MKSFDIFGVSDNPRRAAIVAGAFAAVALLLIALILILRPLPDAQVYDMRILPFQTEAGVEIAYRPGEPVSEIVTGIPAAASEGLNLGIGADALSLSDREGYLAITGDEAFDVATLVIPEGRGGPAKAYPLARFGSEAVVLNMAQVNPRAIDGQRVEAGAAGPAFQWLGPAQTWSGEQISMVFEPSMPPAIQAMIDNTIAVINDYYKAELGGSLDAAPQLMLLHAQGRDGQILIEGDSVRGQSLIRFAGGGVAAQGEEAQRRIRQNIAHELAHLWQLERDGVSRAPDWLHEGAAEAIGLESLYITEKYADADYAAMLEGARAGCAAALRRGPLDKAGGQGRHQASYDCGAILWIALAAQQETDGGAVAVTWAAFADFAENRRDGQSADAFFDFAEDWGGDAFANAARQFVNADFSAGNGDLVIEGLFAADL